AAGRASGVSHTVVAANTVPWMVRRRRERPRGALAVGARDRTTAGLSAPVHRRAVLHRTRRAAARARAIPLLAPGAHLLDLGGLCLSDVLGHRVNPRQL